MVGPPTVLAFLLTPGTGRYVPVDLLNSLSVSARQGRPGWFPPERHRHSNYPAQNVYIVGIHEFARLHRRKRMRKDAEDFTVQSAPAISIAVSELKKINRALELVIARFRVNPGILIVYLNKSAGTNHRMQSVVIHPNESVEIFPKAEILNECDGYFAPSLHNPGEEIGLFNLRSRIEPHWKTYTTFRVIDL